MNNTVRRSRSYANQQYEQQHELARGVTHETTRILIRGTLTVANGAASGTVNDGGILNILSNVRVVLDGMDVLESMTGRDLGLLSQIAHPRQTAATAIANGDPQATPFFISLAVPWSWKYLAKPSDMGLPGWAAQRDLRMYFSTHRDGAALRSALFSAANDRDVSLTDVTITVTETAAQTDLRPFLVPVFTAGFTEQFAAASTDFEYRLRTGRAVLAQFFQYRSGPNGAMQDGINSLSLRGGQMAKYDRVPFDMLREEALNLFEGLSLTDSGTLFLPYVENGLIGQALVAGNLGNDPRVILDVDAPSVAPGVIRILGIEGARIDGVTRPAL